MERNRVCFTIPAELDSFLGVEAARCFTTKSGLITQMIIERRGSIAESISKRKPQAGRHPDNSYYALLK